MLVLFTDTDTDITLEEAREYGYKLISMPYSVGTETVYPYVDWEKFDCKPFYDLMRNGTMPSTGAISADMYKTYFEPVFAEGNDILYVHFSAAMSATFVNMKAAVDELLSVYKGRKFYTIDTKGITIGSHNIVLELGEMYKSGASVEEMIKWSETEVDKFAAYFFADDLKFFKRSGRVGGISATMGTLLGVRPIIHMNSEGKMVSIGKERGREKALERLVSYMEELGEDIGDHRVIIAHCDAEEIVEDFKAKVIERFGDGLRIEVCPVNPTAGAHCGPNSMGVSFHAKHR